MSNRLKIGISMVMGIICLVAMSAHAADGNFAGNWKGEMKITAPPARGAFGSATATGAAVPGTTETPAPSAANSGAGARAGGRAGGPGGFGAGAGVSQEVSLNLKQSKDNKLSGNITFGEGNADDVKEGRVEGDKLILTRIAPAGGRASRTTEYVFSRKK